MRSRVTRFLGSLMPSLQLVARHSTGLTVWMNALDRPVQRSQPSASWLAGRPLSRLAELPRLFRSH